MTELERKEKGKMAGKTGKEKEEDQTQGRGRLRR